jgi:hypothetical protein
MNKSCGGLEPLVLIFAAYEEYQEFLHYRAY